MNQIGRIVFSRDPARANVVKKGQCLCGAVSFAMDEVGDFGICHCRQCQRWTGGPLMAVTVHIDHMEIVGSEHIISRRTSAWASRSHCGVCSSPLWYRHDRGLDDSGDYEVPIGLLDDADKLVLQREIFIDRKPECINFVGNHPRLTEAETLALYGVETDDH